MRPSRRQAQPFVRRWTGGRPSATALLVALSVGGYVAQMLLEYALIDHGHKAVLLQWFALDGAGIAAGEYWKFASYALLHFNPVQLVANMLLLFFAGREVESIIGWRHYLGIYFGGLLVGGIASFFGLPPELVTVGTTAAVTAVVIAFATILPELEVSTNFLFVLPLRLRAKWLAVSLLAVAGVMWSTRTPPEIGAPGILAGGVLGWLYAKQLGFGNPLAIQRYIFNRRQRAARLDRMSPEQFMANEVDPILDKISREGMSSLTRAERKVLKLGREKMGSRTADK